MPPSISPSSGIDSKPSLRFSFNGMEKDDEVKGIGNSLDFGARMYDPRIGRWLSLDPLAAKYPSLSPYNFVANTPLQAIDPDGREIVFLIRDDNGNVAKQFTYKKGDFYDNAGVKYDRIRGANNTMFRLLKAYDIIEKSNDEVLKNQLHTLEESKVKHYVEASPHGRNSVRGEYTTTIDGKKDRSTLQYTQTQFDFNTEPGPDFEGIGKTDLTTVSHELRHQYDHEIDNMKDHVSGGNEKDPAEIRAVHNENRARDIQGLKHRTKYGDKIDSKLLKSPPNNKNPKKP